MRFEWNEAKNRKNLKKQGLDFETAALVFDDPCALSEQDRIVEDEERWQTIGDIGALVLLVAHTWWDEEDGEVVIRLISARKANSAERTSYEAHKKSG